MLRYLCPECKKWIRRIHFFFVSKRGGGGGCAPWLVSSQLNVWPNLTPPPNRQPKAYEPRFIFKVENLRHDHVHLQHEKKIICDQIRKSATSPVLQGRFQCHKKCVCIPILVTTFPEWLSGTEPLPHTPGAVRPSSLCCSVCVHMHSFAGLIRRTPPVMYKTIFVINIIIHMCLQHSNTL